MGVWLCDGRPKQGADRVITGAVGLGKLAGLVLWSEAGWSRWRGGYEEDCWRMAEAGVALVFIALGVSVVSMPLLVGTMQVTT